MTNSKLKELEHRLEGRGLEQHVLLAPYTTFKIGGPADYFLHARTADDVVVAINSARELGIPYFLLGLGANILVGDKGFRGLVVHSEVAGIDFLDDVRVKAGAGVEVFHDLIEATVSRSLGG
ncbi:MAG TPA: FAD-binding protein, partial [Longimicrobiales bacterium]